MGRGEGYVISEVRANYSGDTAAYSRALIPVDKLEWTIIVPVRLCRQGKCREGGFYLKKMSRELYMGCQVEA